MLGVNSKCVTSVPLNIIIKKKKHFRKKKKREKRTVCCGGDVTGRKVVQSYEPSHLGLNSFPSSVQLCVNREQW